MLAWSATVTHVADDPSGFSQRIQLELRSRLSRA